MSHVEEYVPVPMPSKTLPQPTPTPSSSNKVLPDYVPANNIIQDALLKALQGHINATLPYAASETPRGPFSAFMETGKAKSTTRTDGNISESTSDGETFEELDRLPGNREPSDSAAAVPT